jgi:hypothetical protein
MDHERLNTEVLQKINGAAVEPKFLAIMPAEWWPEDAAGAHSARHSSSEQQRGATSAGAVTVDPPPTGRGPGTPLEGRPAR